MSQILIGKAGGTNVGFDVSLLLATRLLITADSGGGKSWLARVLFEQAYGKIQTIIIGMRWLWVPVTCTCCHQRVIGCRLLVMRGPHAHPPLHYCILGMAISVN